MVSSRLEGPYHDPQVWHTCVSPGRVKLTLLVHTPNWLAAISNIVPKGAADGVNGVGEAGCKDDQIVSPFPVSVKNDLVLGETVDSGQFMAGFYRGFRTY